MFKIYSLYNGRDLKITFTEGNGAPTVVDKSVPTPVTKDNELLIKWYYDEKKWSDVFSTKPYDYLKIAYEGEVPWYDKANNHWVTKTEFEGAKTAQETNANAAIKQAEAQFVAEIPSTPVISAVPEERVYTATPDMEDDLPF